MDMNATVTELSTASWTLAAIATLFESGLADALAEPRTLDELAARIDALPRERIARCLDVLALRGVVKRADDRYALAEGVPPPGIMRTSVAGEVRSTLMQSLAYADAATGAPVRGWHHTNPKLLQAQGDSSAMFAVALAMHLAPLLEDLGPQLAKPGARFLDVGAGVASLSISMCRMFPNLCVTGLDVFDVPLAIARENVSRAQLGDRIELRQLAVEDLREEGAFDLAWLPAFFLPPSSIAPAVARTRAALKAGGWILMPTLDVDADPAQRALAAMILEQWCTVTESSEMLRLLEEAGFSPRKLPGPGWLALLAARR